MTDPVMLDTNILGKIAHPNRQKHRDVRDWYNSLLDAGRRVIIPGIADYELRREIIHLDFEKSLTRLDDLRAELEFAPITTGVMDLAAALWAEARKRGAPTADPKELDGDAILAAQAQIVGGAIVATNNVGHLKQWVDARDWDQIPPSCGCESS